MKTVTEYKKCKKCGETIIPCGFGEKCCFGNGWVHLYGTGAHFCAKTLAEPEEVRS